MRRLRVLISSHEFSPYQGSECAVGWNISTGLAKYHDVTVLCADGPPLEPDLYRNAVIDHANKHGEIPGLKVVYVEQPPSTLRYSRLNQKLMKLTKGIWWQPLYYMGLNGWHRATLRKALELGLHNYDVMHQLTPISFLRPGYLWTTDVPFFWGPLGGMYKVPKSFARWGRMSSILFETLRSCNIEWQVRTSRHFRGAVLKAKRIWTITKDEHRTVNGIASGKAALMIESAPPAMIAGRVRQYDGRRVLRLCWSGLHETRKALPLLLHAVAQLPERRNVVLHVLGEGPETRRWQDLAKKLALSGITWYGQLPYPDALKTMEESDVFIHSSIREGTPHVVLESLCWGLPVICHDACGMAVAINDSCGIKVPFENPARSIAGFRDAILSLLQNPARVRQLSEGALRRSTELQWDAKVREIAEAYTLFT